MRKIYSERLLGKVIVFQKLKNCGDDHRSFRWSDEN